MLTLIENWKYYNGADQVGGWVDEWGGEGTGVGAKGAGRAEMCKAGGGGVRKDAWTVVHTSDRYLGGEADSLTAVCLETTPRCVLHPSRITCSASPCQRVLD
jgi:hypothetical protein